MHGFSLHLCAYGAPGEAGGDFQNGFWLVLDESIRTESQKARGSTILDLRIKYWGLNPSTVRRAGCREPGGERPLSLGERGGCASLPRPPGLLAGWNCGCVRPLASVVRRLGVWGAPCSESAENGPARRSEAHAIKSGVGCGQGTQPSAVRSGASRGVLAYPRASRWHQSSDAVSDTPESFPRWELEAPPPNHMFCDARWKEVALRLGRK